MHTGAVQLVSPQLTFHVSVDADLEQLGGIETKACVDFGNVCRGQRAGQLHQAAVRRRRAGRELRDGKSRVYKHTAIP